MNDETENDDISEEQPTEVTPEEVETNDEDLATSDGNDAAEVPADSPPEAEQVVDALEDRNDQQEEQLETD